jgi:tRNA(Ile)-lysidine synthase TilS/MesJ
VVKLSKKILSQIGRTNAKYALIEKNDNILLGLSGGKDSLALMHALAHMQKVTPHKFNFKAVTLSYGMGEDYGFLKEHCQKYGISHEVVDSNVYELSGQKIRKNSSFCSFFSRMRRGILYSYALEHGFNKLALAHHLDDAAESFFMNFIYNGALRSFPPKYRAKNGLVVIRPFIHIRERQLVDNAKNNNLTVVGDEACPAMRFDIKMPHARAKTKELLANLEKEHPQLFISLSSAFENIHMSTFLNKEFLN